MLKGAHLRVARSTRDLDRIADMYRRGLGFEELGSFRDHGGFDGVMLGHQGGGYHLEFTYEHGTAAPVMPDPENLLVFYLPDADNWEETCRRMLDAGFEIVSAHNPYWEAGGCTFVDPDGYRTVLQNAECP